MEVENLPEACKATLRDIEHILHSFGVLDVILEHAPDITRPRRGITGVMKALWALATTTYDLSKQQERLQGAIGIIARKRVRDVIDLHTVTHYHEPELAKYWARLRTTFE